MLQSIAYKHAMRKMRAISKAEAYMIQRTKRELGAESVAMDMANLNRSVMAFGAYTLASLGLIAAISGSGVLA